MPRSSAPVPPGDDRSPADRRRRDVTNALHSLRRVVRALRLAAARTEEATGLSPAQLFVLQAVHAEPGSSLSEIAARTMTDRTSVAAVVARLAERGLVERRRAETDRRRVEIVPTPRARTTLGRAPHAPTHALLEAIKTLSDRDLHHLALGLTRLVRSMGLSDEPPGMFFEDQVPESSPRRPRTRRAGPAPDAADAADTEG
jgi:MarR family transcriptional regulator, organic hydroperoxide resistance regulator